MYMRRVTLAEDVTAVDISKEIDAAVNKVPFVPAELKREYPERYTMAIRISSTIRMRAGILSLFPFIRTERPTEFL